MSTGNNRTIEPVDERCCAEDADIRTESSDCESCKPITIPEIVTPDDSQPFTITQCIWIPKKSETPVEVITPKEETIPKKPKRLPKQTKSQTSIIESNDYNIPELSEFLVLPLHEKDVAAISFGEILLISFLDEKPLKCSEDLFSFKSEKYVAIGGYCNNIQRDGRNIILYSTSQFSCNGKGTRSSIYSLCDSSFNLIEEKRVEEYTDENGEKREKGIHLIKESVDGKSDQKRVIAFRTENENKIISKYHSKIRINVLGPLLPDGMNFVLLRYLVTVGYIGTFETWTININGRICRSEYIFKTFTTVKINSTLTDVIPVIRNVTSLVDPPEIIKMFFLPTGHMIRHAWEYYPFILHINPLASIPPSGFILNSFETWQQQIELVSKYLDCKDNAQSKLKTYLNDKPEVRCMIKDYIALLLNIKPANILELTIEYFMNLDGDVQTVTEEIYEESDSDSEFSNIDSSSGSIEEQFSDDDES